MVSPIYLDHNATTPPAPAAVEAVARASADAYGNPSSIHAAGQRARRELDGARSEVAALIGADPGEVVFTSGGTEADNLAIRGVADAGEGRKRRRILVGAVEHEAVLNTARALARHGWPIAVIPADSRGVVTGEALAALLDDETALVSVMLANNETGVVQPVAELAALARSRGALFHTDAVQAVAKIPVDVGALGVDLLSLTGHKFSGPKGAGALWIRRGTPMASFVTGGRQERGRRAGTENVPAIAGLGVVSRLVRETGPEASARVGALRDRLEAGILDRVPRSSVNGAGAPRVPNTTNISFQGLEAESLLIALDLEGILVSTGSACSSGTLEPSHVLRAMGLPPARVQSSIRFSLGPGNSEEEIDRVLDVLPRVVERIRRVGRG